VLAKDPVKENGVIDIPALNATKLVACVAAKNTELTRNTIDAIQKSPPINFLCCSSISLTPTLNSFLQLIISISFLDISGCYFRILCKGFPEYHEDHSFQELIGRWK